MFLQAHSCVLNSFLTLTKQSQIKVHLLTNSGALDFIMLSSHSLGLLCVERCDIYRWKLQKPWQQVMVKMMFYFAHSQLSNRALRVHHYRSAHTLSQSESAHSTLQGVPSRRGTADPYSASTSTCRYSKTQLDSALLLWLLPPAFRTFQSA